MKVVRRNLSLPDCSALSGSSSNPGGQSADRPPQDPRQFLTQLLLKTPVPLWIPSCKSRTTGWKNLVLIDYSKLAAKTIGSSRDK